MSVSPTGPEIALSPSVLTLITLADLNHVDFESISSNPRALVSWFEAGRTTSEGVWDRLAEGSLRVYRGVVAMTECSRAVRSRVSGRLCRVLSGLGAGCGPGRRCRHGREEAVDAGVQVGVKFVEDAAVGIFCLPLDKHGLHSSQRCFFRWLVITMTAAMSISGMTMKRWKWWRVLPAPGQT